MIDYPMEGFSYTPIAWQIDAIEKREHKNACCIDIRYLMLFHCSLYIDKWTIKKGAWNIGQFFHIVLTRIAGR